MTIRLQWSPSVSSVRLIGEPNCLRNASRKGLAMSKVIVSGFALSIDGFGAGPEQTLTDPLGKRGLELHEWFFGTKTFRAMIGKGGGSEGVDESYAARSMSGFGAFVLGRNMFGPIR